MSEVSSLVKYRNHFSRKHFTTTTDVKQNKQKKYMMQRDPFLKKKSMCLIVAKYFFEIMF